MGDLDFGVLRGIHTVEMATDVFTYFMSVEKSVAQYDSAELMSTFESGTVQYQLTRGDESNEEAFAPLEALFQHYAENRKCYKAANPEPPEESFGSSGSLI